jgi:hypothetical protein
MKDKLLGIYGLSVIFFMWIYMTGTPNYPGVGFFEALVYAIIWPVTMFFAFQSGGG